MATSASTWMRPDSVPFPSVWRRHVGLKEMPDGKKPKFIIQDITDELLEDVIHLMSEQFCRDEAMFGALKVVDDPISMKELQDLWRKLCMDRAALVAVFDDGSLRPRVVGANITFVCRNTDRYSPDDFEGVAMKAMARDGMVYACKYIDIFGRYGVSEYLSALGLVVHPEFRGQGLGLEILKARFDLGKAVGLKVTMTFFTTVQGQKVSEKVGMDCLAEIPYSIFKTEDDKDVYPNIHPKSLKIMAKRIYE